jgi:hypothetical protein
MSYMGISRMEGMIDLRPPELIKAIDNIVPGYSAISDHISHFLCRECGVSAPWLEDLAHPPTCQTGKILDRYRKALPLYASHDAREILKQWHENAEPHRDGAYYVQFERGNFTMRPFGDTADFRYSFEVRRESYVPQAPWIFVVMC